MVEPSQERELPEPTASRLGAAGAEPLPGLAHAYEQGRREYGALPLAFDRFAAEATARIRRRLQRAGEPASAAAEAIWTMAGADLYLAIACDVGVAGAWETLTVRLVPRLRAFAARQGVSEPEADLLAREIPGSLLAEPGREGARTRLGTYEGRGTLLAWLAVILARRIADRARSPEARAARLDREEALLAPPDRSARGEDPAERAETAEAAGRLGETFRRGWEALTAKEAAAVLFRFREGLPQKEIAGLLSVGEPRVSRLLSRALEKLGGALRPVLPDLPRGAVSEHFWGGLRDAIAHSLATAPDPLDQGTRTSRTHASG